MGNIINVEAFQATPAIILAPLQCPPGTYGGTTGQATSACSGQCSAGYYCGAGSTSPTQNLCPSGYYCLAGTGDSLSSNPPRACAAGTSSLAGASRCSPCPSGYSSTTASQCSPCATNSYSVNLCGSTSALVSAVSPPGPTGLAPMGVQMWYDGNDPAGNGLPTNNGTVITSWKDKSGNGFHATITGSPTSNTNVANNKSAVLFNRSSLGTATYLLSPNTFQTAFQVFVVSKSVSTTDNGANTPITLGSTSQFDPWNASRYLSNGQAICQSPNNLYNTNLNLFGALLFQGSGSYYTEWLNGIPVPSTSLTGTKSGFTAVTNTNNLYIGGRQDRNTSWNGYIYEIAVYNSVLSTTERQAVEGYLAWKWGFQTSLSVSHPYYSVAPTFAGLTNPPFKPTGVTAVNSAAGLVVTWSGGAGAMSYVIRVSGTLQTYSITVNGSNLYTGTVPQVAIGESYTVNVRAENAYGSTLSDTIVITLPNIQVSRVAGMTGTGVSRIDGLNELAFIYRPMAIVSNSCGSSLYVADTNHSIRKIFLQTDNSGTVTTMVTTYAGTGVAGVPAYIPTSARSAAFNNPYGLAIDSSDTIYVADTYNHSIRKITPQGSVIHVAGSAQGYSDSTGTAASFRFPTSLAVDSTGNIYVADLYNHCIRKITVAAVVSTFAGAASAGSADGVGINARFNQPWGIAIDSLGNLYVADSGNNTIRKITPTGVVTTVAGLAGAAGFVDGVGSCARFNFPVSIAIDVDGTLYVVDGGNHSVRQVLLNSVSSVSASPTCAVTNQAIATVRTVAGAGSSGYTNGAGNSSRFNLPYGISIDPTGILYVADTYNNVIRKITILPRALQTQSTTCATLCKPCCPGTVSVPGSSYCTLYPGYLMNSAGNFRALLKGFYQNGVNTQWAAWFIQMLPSSLTANTITDMGNFNTCTLHLLPGWTAFGYLNRTPLTLMELDPTPYTGSTIVRPLTYLLIIVSQNEITFTTTSSGLSPSFIPGSGRGSGSGSTLSVLFPRKVCGDINAVCS